MSTQYIVKFCKNIDTNEPFVDGYIELNKSILGYGTIEFKSELNSNLVDSPNIVIFRKMLTNQYLLISYDDNNRDCFLEYSDTFNSKIKYKSVIRFDESSHSAYNEFKKNLLELTTTQMETIQYTNGRILYIGEVLYIKKFGHIDGNHYICYKVFKLYRNQIKKYPSINHRRQSLMNRRLTFAEVRG